MLLLLGLSTSLAEAEKACLTHQEARAAYGYGLRWVSQGGRRCWGVGSGTRNGLPKRNPPAETKSSELKSAGSFSSEVNHQLGTDPPPNAEGGLYPTWVFEERRGVNSQEFTPRRLDDNTTSEIRAIAPYDASSSFPVSVTGILLILLMSGLVTVYKLGKEAWGHYAVRRVPGDRIGGSRSRDRLLWLLLGQEPGGRQPNTRPPA